MRRLLREVRRRLHPVLCRVPFYGRLTVVRKRRRLLRGLRVWGAHEEKMLRFYGQFVSAGSLVYDVGANIGNRVRVFVRQGARVVAVEPQRACVAVLRQQYEGSDRVVVVPKALGARPGRAEMAVCDLHVMSSLSPAWVDLVSRSPRFRGRSWSGREMVEIVTLDRLIAEEGEPDFVKIDVEGYEPEVLKGLTRPVKALSIEFTPDYPGPALACLDRLDALGAYEYNYSLGESMRLAKEAWLTGEGIRHELTGLVGKTVFGDLYARLLPPP